MGSDLKITSKAQEILNTFMKEMSSISVDNSHSILRKNNMRNEGLGGFSNDEFREAFLNNAVKRNNNAIITKKGDWTKS